MQEWLGDNMWGAWLAAALVLGVLELFSLDLVLLMLSVGALAGMATALVTGIVPLQVLVAVIAAVGMLAVVRPGLIKRLHGGPDLRTGTAALIGLEGWAVGEITPQGGQAKLGGEIWSARPYDEMSVIREGARVQVFEIRGATAYVHEVPELGS